MKNKHGFQSSLTMVSDTRSTNTAVFFANFDFQGSKKANPDVFLYLLSHNSPIDSHTNF